MIRGFEQAQREYEARLESPFDTGSALFDYEEDARRREEMQDDLGNIEYQKMKDEVA